MSAPHNWSDSSAPYYAPPPPYFEKEPSGGPDPRYPPVQPSAPFDYGTHIPSMPNEYQPYSNALEEPIIPQPEAASSDPPAQVPNHLCYAICSLFCCLPLGTAALIYALLTRESNLTGNIAAAQRTSKMAWKFATIALGIGLGILLIYIIMFVVLVTLIY